MKIYLATDHAGFELKEAVKTHLLAERYDAEDCGAFEYNEYDDYPDFISKAAEKVSENPKESMAIILGGTGQGEAIAANKFRNVRAIVYNSENLELIRLGRIHNDANILSVGARFISQENAIQAVMLFLTTAFTEEERHMRRIKQIAAIEHHE